VTANHPFRSDWVAGPFLRQDELKRSPDNGVALIQLAAPSPCF
jgi:hypothetical protein